MCWYSNSPGVGYEAVLVPVLCSAGDPEMEDAFRYQGNPRMVWCDIL